MSEEQKPSTANNQNANTQNANNQGNNQGTSTQQPAKKPFVDNSSQIVTAIKGMNDTTYTKKDNNSDNNR